MVIVTGAGAGIGEAIAHKFAKEGAVVNKSKQAVNFAAAGLKNAFAK